MNKVILIGNVGSTPEIKTLDGGTQVANFSMATTENYIKKDGTKVQDTTWHRIEVWNGIAKVVEKFIQKGDRLCIEGKIIVQEWTAEDGTKRNSVKIRVERLELLGNRREQVEKEAEKEENKEPETKATKGKKSSVVFESDVKDLPF
jgi:single-strand DNA-binding protein